MRFSTLKDGSIGGQKEAPMAAGTTGALVAQGANSNGFLDDAPVVSGAAGGSSHYRSRSIFRSLRRCTSPVDRCGSYLENVEPRIARVSLARSAVTIT